MNADRDSSRAFTMPAGVQGVTMMLRLEAGAGVVVVPAYQTASPGSDKGAVLDDWSPFG